MSLQGIPPQSDASIERDLGLPVKTCPGCRTANQPTAQYCYQCGLKLADTATVPLIQPAGFWRRLCSYLIDSIFIAFANFVVFTLVFAVVFSLYPDMMGKYAPADLTFKSLLDLSQTTMTWLDWVIYGLGLAFTIGYWTIATGWKGRTVGKLMLGMQVVRSDGSRVGYGRAFGRYWGYVICWLTLGLGFLVIVFNQDKRGLHDLICDTVVIRK